MLARSAKGHAQKGKSPPKSKSPPKTRAPAAVPPSKMGPPPKRTVRKEDSDSSELSFSTDPEKYRKPKKQLTSDSDTSLDRHRPKPKKAAAPPSPKRPMAVAHHPISSMGTAQAGLITRDLEARALSSAGSCGGSVRGGGGGGGGSAHSSDVDYEVQRVLAQNKFGSPIARPAAPNKASPPGAAPKVPSPQSPAPRTWSEDQHAKEAEMTDDQFRSVAAASMGSPRGPTQIPASKPAAEKYNAAEIAADAMRGKQAPSSPPVPVKVGPPTVQGLSSQRNLSDQSIKSLPPAVKTQVGIPSVSGAPPAGPVSPQANAPASPPLPAVAAMKILPPGAPHVQGGDLPEGQADQIRESSVTRAAEQQDGKKQSSKLEKQNSSGFFADHGVKDLEPPKEERRFGRGKQRTPRDPVDEAENKAVPPGALKQPTAAPGVDRAPSAPPAPGVVGPPPAGGVGPPRGATPPGVVAPPGKVGPPPGSTPPPQGVAAPPGKSPMPPGLAKYNMGPPPGMAKAGPPGAPKAGPPGSTTGQSKFDSPPTPTPPAKVGPPPGSVPPPGLAPGQVQQPAPKVAIPSLNMNTPSDNPDHTPNNPVPKVAPGSVSPTPNSAFAGPPPGAIRPPAPGGVRPPGQAPGAPGKVLSPNLEAAMMAPKAPSAPKPPHMSGPPPGARPPAVGGNPSSPFAKDPNGGGSPIGPRPSAPPGGPRPPMAGPRPPPTTGPPAPGKFDSPPMPHTEKHILGPTVQFCFWFVFLSKCIFKNLYKN